MDSAGFFFKTAFVTADRSCACCPDDAPGIAANVIEEHARGIGQHAQSRLRITPGNGRCMERVWQCAINGSADETARPDGPGMRKWSGDHASKLSCGSRTVT